MDVSKILATLFGIVATQPKLIPLALAVIGNTDVQKLGAAVPALVPALTEAAARNATTLDLVRVGATWAKTHDVPTHLRSALNDPNVFEFLEAAIDALKTNGGD